MEPKWILTYCLMGIGVLICIGNFYRQRKIDKTMQEIRDMNRDDKMTRKEIK